jgi:hypothetical protein
MPISFVVMQALNSLGADAAQLSIPATKSSNQSP